MKEIPECFYRVSIKALVLDETREKFLLAQEEDGEWELPGGGLDWGTTPQEDLPREIAEEMGLRVTHMAKHPCYLTTTKSRKYNFWIINVLYETELEHLDFTPSEECIDIRFVNTEEALALNIFPNVENFVKQFDPMLHTKALS